ncbi:acyl-CoA thioesterase [uncultured Bradyrhizobium sp.]|uniref:acyl-CoA thioesterase n=1 Tax=uncultured Bradyrhizobium sp. TaxID=199684 RepID=UPI0035CB4821
MNGFKFQHEVRVRYSEIDGQKLVYHGHYLTYFDCAMVEYFRERLQLDASGQSLEDVFELALVKTTLEFAKPARLDDRLAVWCRVDRTGRSSLDMDFKITRAGDETPLVTGRTVYVHFDAGSTMARPIPVSVLKAILEYEGADDSGIARATIAEASPVS